MELSTVMAAEQHDFQQTSDTVPANLTALAKTKFKRITEVECPFEDVRGLRVIANQLWSCQYQSIKIYDKNLKHIRTLQNEEWGYVNDVALMPYGGFVIACGTRLLYIDDAGYLINEIDSGDFTSIDIYKGTLFASETETIRSYIYSGNGWVEQGIIELPRSGFYTISVQYETITVCNSHSSTIDVLSMAGQHLHSYGHEGTECAGELQRPLLCQEDREGALLVADYENSRLQILDKHLDKWSIVDMEPKLKYPKRVVYVDDTLCVESGDLSNYKICKYIAK